MTGNAGSNYGDLSSLASIAGQNASPPCEKLFGVHYILSYTKEDGQLTYYDPSYGKAYETTASFDGAAIFGFCKPLVQQGAWFDGFVRIGDPFVNEIVFLAQ